MLYNLVGMFTRLLKTILIMAGMPILLIACGELDSVLPSSGTYRVSALVGKYSLDEYSIITKKDMIRPFFINSVLNDPDITGLAVFFQSPNGEIAGGKVLYTLKTDNTGARPGNDAESGNNPYDAEDGKDAPDKFEIEPEEQDPPQEFAPESEEQDPPQEFEAEEQDYPQEFAPESEEQGSSQEFEAEEQDYPQEFTPGSEDQGSPQESDDTAAEQDYPRSFTPAPDNEPVVSDPSAVTDTVIYVSRLDRDLPYFPPPKNLSIGRYTLVFQVLGKKEVLDQVERSVYYIGDVEFTPGDIQSYPPGIFTVSPLMPPGLTIMLETQVRTGKGLDPYIVWYNGKKRIYEGSIAEGAGHFLWKTPDKTGFHTLRAEVFPFKPALNLKGTIRELSLPVSVKHEYTGAFAKKADQFTNWYQFVGDLRDTKAPADMSRALTGAKNHSPRWLPAEGIYGLAIGPGNTYQVPFTPLVYSEDEQAEGKLLLRFSPVSAGIIFSALFERKDDSPVTLEMGLFTGKEGMILGLNVGENSIAIPLESPENKAFITAGIGFSLSADYFTAALSLENSGNDIPEPVIIPLSSPLSGKGTFRLGSVQGSANSGTAAAVILDEFAAMYQVTPFVKEEADLDVDPGVPPQRLIPDSSPENAAADDEGEQPPSLSAETDLAYPAPDSYESV
ncbi:hypothetical protein FACS189450_08990 [Spirochaetia bacterium]|nr:hypothetical protein FACS189450_08990 [Spirochaetia bacterium]